ncbi:neo-calmodulin-like [Bolinopsis microptera]|uniref:neo-calmodulin-like n=1 Tax=Bolinopsis microptera TaxID=2820187 RepID=UPI003079023D
MSASEPLITDPKVPGDERKIFLKEVCRDWKFHRDDVLKEVFEMVDKDGDEKLTEKEMGQALRFLGLNPTEPQIREMIIEQNTPKGKLTYKQFVDSLETAIGSWSVYEDLMFAFSVFDPTETGYANRTVLKDHLTMIGDPLDEDEAEEWLSLVQSNSKGDINYQSLIKRVLHDEGWLEDQTKTDK